jgi:two-component system cell cycle sensor histidine kinase/response regulator CckA
MSNIELTNRGKCTHMELEAGSTIGHAMAASSGASGQKTILIVDDNAEILAQVSKFLSGTGCNIITACSGEEGLRQSRDFAGEISLLLSDFQMPGMTGVELATAVTLERPHIKVLLMSGFTGGMLVLNEGWHFMAKPFLPSQLLALVTGLVYPEKKSPHFTS